MQPEKNFIIFPAIDLRGGEVVRLKEGDPKRQTNYSTDPGGTARRWIEAGAAWLHVVNLDGAFGESGNANLQALRTILSEAARANVQVQFGGGMRSVEAIEAALDAGVSRAILGTLAVEQPRLFEEALNRWGAEKIGVSLDARDGRVQVRGWQSDTPLMAVDAARGFQHAGLRWLVFTDIARDGLQTGLNLQATLELAQASKLNVIASGGVSRLEDVRAAEKAGLAGAIVGRALYEGFIDPVELLAR
ncbi:MAG: 1-(5-phosphoribosyl)-5-[(5-phosphoribosylamino)methylideneamino]imidazole-4-carboxamide isomerase [Anaerolineaceae bacterium]|nr:1-(5-phosphoribosyl)-5-[(5-phosphoribosylamino)methylideneamino]imidazole-4-carboxamide isomerase [Anaerolineaceae bacterium]